MGLYRDEQEAKDFVLKLGQVRADRLLSAISRRIARRVFKANQDAPEMFFDGGSIRKADWEVSLIYKLRMGFMLTQTMDTAEDRKDRMLARRKAYRERAMLARLSERNQKGVGVNEQFTFVL